MPIFNKSLLLTMVFCTTTIVSLLANDINLGNDTKTELEKPSLQPLLEKTQESNQQTKEFTELEASKNAFSRDESLLSDLFNTLDDEDEDLRSLPIPKENFRYLNLIKEILIFAHRENPRDIKIFLAALATAIGCSIYVFPKSTIGTLTALVLADFVTTQYSNCKIR